MAEGLEAQGRVVEASQPDEDPQAEGPKAPQNSPKTSRPGILPLIVALVGTSVSIGGAIGYSLARSRTTTFTMEIPEGYPAGEYVCRLTPEGESSCQLVDPVRSATRQRMTACLVLVNSATGERVCVPLPVVDGLNSGELRAPSQSRKEVIVVPPGERIPDSNDRAERPEGSADAD